MHLAVSPSFVVVFLLEQLDEVSTPGGARVLLSHSQPLEPFYATDNSQLTPSVSKSSTARTRYERLDYRMSSASDHELV